MNPRFLSTLPVFALACAFATGSASAVSTFVETFDTNASNWLNGAPSAPTYNSTGGIGNSGFISYTSTFTSGASGNFGAPPLTLQFRGNSTADASGDAFVGNWINDGVLSLSISVRHNYSSPLNFYTRIDAGAGRGASLAFESEYAVAPDTWTTITIPITDGNPPFLSYGAGTFETVFSNVQNLQFGFYVPASTTFTDLRMDIDNVTITAVPEPTALGLIAFGGIGALALRRRRSVR